MLVEVVRIGNSRGIRIPKPIIQQCGFGARVDLRIERDSLVVSPDRPPRSGWVEAFRAAGPSGSDEVLLETTPANEFDREEWRW
jgi:antitoxin MazE